MDDTSFPAFPVQDASKWQAHGISMRDYFAAAALPAIIQTCANDTPLWGTIAQMFARRAYEVADAMLEARGS